VDLAVNDTKSRAKYSSETYSQDTLLIHPAKLGCGIPAAAGLDNSFQLYNSLQIYTVSKLLRYKYSQ
jgi:hypothetical protein